MSQSQYAMALDDASQLGSTWCIANVSYYENQENVRPVRTDLCFHFHQDKRHKVKSRVISTRTALINIDNENCGFP